MSRMVAVTAPQTQESPVVGEEYLTAWHEAGHAVVYLLQGRSLRYVTLRPRTAGRVGFTAVRPRRVELSTLAVVAHAGPLAQARYVLDTTSAAERLREGITAGDVRVGAYLHGGHDDLAVIAQARRAYGLAAGQSDLWAGIAQDLIDRYWTEIGRVAAELLEHRTLTGAQLRACVPGHRFAR
ncbi:hypothetical protein [Amycolatopsis sp. 195334CR]|uniref:hypothetical protein n=1 Tax=Amycolatopsis sp. 195334CR TaxID=2814588 RepID=UPI001A8FB6A0|nr:hypothetical protein [Amycolatopsis sp. 195334CR]MBN6034157.1 hypothetical protein [Amycolatopsis sp. 195334CR]